MVGVCIQRDDQFIVIGGGQRGDLAGRPVEPLGQFDLIIVPTTCTLLALAVEPRTPTVIQRLGVVQPKG